MFFNRTLSERLFDATSQKNGPHCHRSAARLGCRRCLTARCDRSAGARPRRRLAGAWICAYARSRLARWSRTRSRKGAARAARGANLQRTASICRSGSARRARARRRGSDGLAGGTARLGVAYLCRSCRRVWSARVRWLPALLRDPARANSRSSTSLAQFSKRKVPTRLRCAVWRQSWASRHRPSTSIFPTNLPWRSR